ncbi:MAG: hypothetical protein CMO01_27155 [Thalassobius sp.]|nr:hypothetical protein [Thalassovita sp.]
MRFLFEDKLLLLKVCVKNFFFRVVLLLLSFFFPTFIANAYDTVFVATNFTTHLLFEDSIIHTECLPAISPVYDESGFMVDSVMQVGLNIDHNKIYLYANTNQLPDANLYVETTTGIYMFILVYKETPQKLFSHIERNRAIYDNKTASNNIIITNSMAENTAPLIQEITTNTTPERRNNNSSKFDNQCEQIIQKEKFQTATAKRDMRIEFAVSYPYTSGEYTYIHVYLNNLSNIPFNLRGDILFISSEKSKIKRQTVTEIKHDPVFVYNQKSENIQRGFPLHTIYVFKNFTLQDSKKLSLHLIEKDGGRDITLTLNHNYLLNAKNL